MNNYWLLKSEPTTFSIDDLAKKPQQITAWDGVRNYQARNYLRQMKQGDKAFFYHSSCPVPGIVGLIEIIKTAYPETDPRWSQIDVKLLQKLPGIITLKILREIPELSRLVILQKGNRLSVTPVSPSEWNYILKMPVS